MAVAGGLEEIEQLGGHRTRDDFGEDLGGAVPGDEEVGLRRDIDQLVGLAGDSDAGDVIGADR